MLRRRLVFCSYVFSKCLVVFVSAFRMLECVFVSLSRLLLVFSLFVVIVFAVYQ